MTLEIEQYSDEPQSPVAEINNLGEVIVEGRLLSRIPSPEIAALRQRFPLLYKIEQSKFTVICPNSSINFIGALIVDSVKGQILDELRKVPNERPNAKISKPIEVINNVRIFEKTAGTAEPLNLTLDNVLVKHIAGRTTGVVLSGPYAGLVLETLKYDSNISPGMAVTRIWNNDAAQEKPYEIAITTESGTRYPNQRGYDIYKNKRDALLSSPDFIYRPLSESFFALLNKASIPINPEEFHTSDYARFNRSRH